MKLLELTLDRQLSEGACPSMQPFHAFVYPIHLGKVKRLSQAYAQRAIEGNRRNQLAPRPRPRMPPIALPVRCRTPVCHSARLTSKRAAGSRQGSRPPRFHAPDARRFPRADARGPALTSRLPLVRLL